MGTELTSVIFKLQQTECPKTRWNIQGYWKYVLVICAERWAEKTTEHILKVTYTSEVL